MLTLSTPSRRSSPRYAPLFPSFCDGGGTGRRLRSLATYHDRMGQGSATADVPETVRVHLLGPFAIDGVDIGALGSRKARALLAELAMARGRVVGTDTLIDDLWGAAPPAKPSDQLSVLASRCRAVLGAERLERAGSGYRLTVDWLDLDEVDDLADQATASLAAGRAPSARSAAAAARRLLAAPLLEGEPDAAWAEDERHRLDLLAGRLAAVAAEAELLGGDPRAAAQLADECLARDPYDERAVRILMRAHCQAGRPASALAAYARARDRLREDLGVSPTAETEAVHTAILMGPGGSDGTDGATAPQAGGAIPARPVRLVGREPELAVLREALTSLPAAGARVVAVTGEAGIGKSTLVRAWTAELRGQGVTVLSGAADLSGSGLPLQPVLDALATYLHGLEVPDAEQLVAPDVAVLDPLLGRRAPGIAPVTGVDVVDAGTARQILFTALVGVLQRIATRDPTGGGAPTVVVLDDVHAAGGATRDWIGFARRRLLDGRVLVVAATRPEVGRGEAPLPADVRLALGPLGVEAATELVGPERAADLVARSDGHPLFLVELAAADDDDLPDSIRDAVATRLRQAPDIAPLVEAAAVVGSPVDLDLLAGVLEASPGEVLTGLELAVGHRFLDERGASFVFHHALVQQAVAAGVGSSRQTFLHRQAAHLLAQRPDADPFAVAFHARLGGDRLLAARALTAASGRAAEAQDYEEARRLLDEAISLDDAVETRRRRAIVLLCLGRFDAAADDAENALGRDPRPEVVEVAAWCAYYQRDFDRALRHAEWVAGSPDAGPSAAAGHTVMGRILHARGDLAAADEHLTEGFERSAPDQRAVTTVWLAGLRNHQARHTEALGLLRGAVRPGVVMSQPFATVHGLLNRSYALALSGRPAEALAALDEADLAVEAHGQTARYAAAVSNYRAWVLRYLGAADEADAANLSALEGTTFVEAQAQAMVDLVDGCLHRGDLDGAAAWLATAAPLQLDDHAMRWRHALRARLLDARLALGRNDRDRARGLAAEVVAEAGRLGLPRYEVLGALTGHWAVAAAAGGAVADTAEDLRRGLDELAGVAGLESWWWTAQLARVTGDARIDQLARQRVASLADAAGDRSQGLITAAGRLLDG